MQLLIPLAALFDGITRLRNFLFDKGHKKSIVPPVASIGVGNLTIGGTGKTPHIEYLIRLFQNDRQIVTLSRGYGRKTKGFLWADETADADSVGDEPMQFYQKFNPHIRVAVGEKRVPAMERILEEAPETDLLLLDDVFQHRYIKPQTLILLSDYNRPFYEDLILPAGRLRESRQGAKRADAVIVTKCPVGLPEEKKKGIQAKIQQYTDPDTPIFFSSIAYADPISLFRDTEMTSKSIFVVTGIANKKPLRTYLESKFEIKGWLQFPDHHAYTESDVVKIQNELPPDTSILTTEKDAVKLKAFPELPVFYLPIWVSFLGDGFDKWIK
ncbi:MAG: tetraacyldisaccharide 4'-kinase [Bacteroidota bacterium]